MTVKKQQSIPQKLKIENLRTIEPLTLGQARAHKAWKNDKCLVLNGTAGTGKTFTALYLALWYAMDKSTVYDKVIICRSIVPTREIGFLPGTLEEKLDAYTGPYRAMCANMFEDATAYDKLVHQGQVEFVSTSHIRGMTYDNAIIIVDEMQNLTFHELDSIITRVGENTKIMFSGDYYQSDFTKQGDRQGIIQFLKILDTIKYFESIEFTANDVVRSDFVKDYILAKEKLTRNNQ
jgi:predicted ribonuclease YlaK